MKGMNRSTMGVIAAVLLALVGGLLLWRSSSESTSQATEEPVEQVQVLVAARDIEAGESASTMAENAFAYVELQTIPIDQRLPGALTSVEELDELGLGRNVTASPIALGSQIVASMFIVPGEQATSALDDVPENVFQITVALEPQRALGGFVRAGQRVAVVGSFDAAGEEPGQTVVILDDVEITNVQAEQLLSAEQMSTDPLAPTLAPNTRLFVTFGVEVEDLERLTYAVEFGRIWLAHQGDEADVADSTIRERDNVVVAVPDQDDPLLAGDDTEGDAAAEGE